MVDLSLDASAEYLGSAAKDGSIAVHGLHSEEALGLAHPQPVLVSEGRTDPPGSWNAWALITGGPPPPSRGDADTPCPAAASPLSCRRPWRVQWNSMPRYLNDLVDTTGSPR